MSDVENEKLVAPADFDGPTRNRHCTDILCLLMLVASWVVMTWVGLYAVTNGDYRVVLYPFDYEGNICGTDYAGNMTDFPYLLYVNSFTGGVCVQECPDLSNLTEDGLTDIRTLITYNGVWQPSTGDVDPQLPLDYVVVADYSKSNYSHSCTEDLCYPDGSVAKSWSSEGIRRGAGYAYYAGSTYELLGRCLMTTSAVDRIQDQVNGTALSVSSGVSALMGLDAVDQVYDFWNRLFADLWTARKYILGFGFGVSLLVSSIYIFLLRLPVLLNAMVWGSILISIAMFYVAGYYAWNISSQWEDANPKTVDDKSIKTTQAAAVVLFLIGTLLALVTCCMRKAIQLAILCVKEAGKAINSMLLILAIPFIQALALAIFVTIYSVYSVYLSSLGGIETKSLPLVLGLDYTQDVYYRAYAYDEFVAKWSWYLLFCFYWTANFIVAAGDMMISVAVAKWYFARNKATIGSWTVLSSMRETLCYHLGTCAYGSLLIATVQLIRSMIARAQKYAKDTHNCVAQYLLCCCQCCFCCLERCLKFINKHAYIQTAIFSTTFCQSCRSSFWLVFRNAARLGAVSYVSAALLIVGKLFISTITTMGGYMILLEKLNDQLFSVAGPVAFIFLISYWVSDFFMDVFDMCITTVLHCFIADEEMFSGDSRYAESSLTSYINKHGSHRDS